MPKVPYQNIEGPPEQTHTEYLIIPKMEILEDLEITFDKECEDSDFIFPKEESDSRERDLLKPIKTE
ncbi:jg10579, partial [Pararge aegeria aegeria]